MIAGSPFSCLIASRFGKPAVRVQMRAEIIPQKFILFLPAAVVCREHVFPLFS